MAKEWDKWLAFLKKYQDRFVYGTDFYAFQRDENGAVRHNVRPQFVRNLFETDGEHLYMGEAFKGIKLDKALRDKIYRDNFARLYPQPRRIDYKWIVAQAEEVYNEKKFHFGLDAYDCEYIIKKCN